MKSKRYVQHISGQGQKWEVMTDNGHQWGLRHDVTPIGWHFVPKSEYRLCDPPEVWRDCTDTCELTEDPDGCQHIRHDGRTRFVTAWNGTDYRFRKVQLMGPSSTGGAIQWAFIVEQKVQP